MAELSFKIVDGHAHLASTHFIPQSFLMGVAANMERALPGALPGDAKTKLYGILVANLQDHDGTRLIGEMDNGGIEKAVILLPDFSYALKDCKYTIEEMFAQHADVLANNKERFSVLAGVDPRWGKDGIALFEKGIYSYGFSGLKLYPPCGYRANDRSLYPYYEICAKEGLPVLVHTGGTSPALSFEEARPIFIDQPARDFPEVNFILAHGASVYEEESIMMCTHRPNVYLDLSASAAAPLKKLQAIASAPIKHKIIYGSDWPLFSGKSSPRDDVSRLLSGDSPFSGLSEQDSKKIFRNNILKLLGEQTD